MTSEEKSSFLNSKVACAMIRAMGMQAENQMRERGGLSPAYREGDFENLIASEGIGHNDVITLLRQ